MAACASYGTAFFAAALSGCSLDVDRSTARGEVVESPGLTAKAIAGTPALEGEWGPTFSVPIEAVHAFVLPTGKVLIFDVKGGVRYWDPSTGAFSSAPQPSLEIFCSGHAPMADGKLLVAGGRNNISSFGEWNASLFDPASETWTMLPDMTAGRWYPSAATLANGDVLVLAGAIDPSTKNTLPQVWSVSSGSWRNLTGAAQLVVPDYPRLHLAPNGKMFMSGPDRMTRYLDTSGVGAWIKVAAQAALRRVKGSSVQYDDGKILVMGGANDASSPPVATAEVISLGAASPQWTSVAPMAVARVYANATLLPDGKVLVTGGSMGPGFDDWSAPALPTETWDPATSTWTTTASLGVYRGYHSTAVLLPDGRVLSAGGYQIPPGARSLSGEIYSPPYLFKGPRPEITTAPASVDFGETFHVDTPDPAAIAKAVWISLPAVTHAFNMSQRRNVLAFSAPPDGGLSITAPSDPNKCPPGYKMLFLLDSAGVPSVARIVRVGSGAGSSPAVPGPAPALVASVQGGNVSLTWGAAPTNATGFKIDRAMSLQNGIWSPFVTVPAGDTSFTDTSVGPATTYHYRIRAYNAAGHSPYSKVVAAKVP